MIEKVIKIGFDVNGINQYTHTEYDTGGYNARGFNEEGINQYTGTEYDKDGFNKEGYNSNGEHYKENIPYYKIAKASLLSWNKDMTEEQVQQAIESSSIAQLEEKVGAKNSIKYALQTLVDSLLDEELIGVSEARYYFSDLADNVFSGEESSRIDNIREYLDRMEFKNEFVVRILSNVHDGWVKDNQKKFMARDKKYQHMPIELIGWEEAKADLLFLRPILAEMNVSCSEEALEEFYNERVQEFFKEKGITDISKLAEQISKGAEFYPVLEGQEDVIAKLADSEFVENTLIPQIAEKGFGSIEKMEQCMPEPLEKISEADKENASDKEKKAESIKKILEQQKTIKEQEQEIEKLNVQKER